MPAFRPPEEQLELVTRGVAELYTREDLLERFRLAREQGRPLRVKLGLDPSAPDVHLGHAVVLRKAREFQDLGHRAIIIIGDFTGRVGDPSGRSVTRPQLSAEEIDRNAATYLRQVGSILDQSPEKLELRKNSEWLASMDLVQVLRLASRTTVARLMERDTFEKRWKAGEPIGFHEFFYPLLQGYDSVAIESDLELGGTDQTYNNLFGRDLQRSLGQLPQVVLTMPILRGLDGVQKMSKSLGNYVGVTESADRMVQKLYSMPDDLVLHYVELLTGQDLAATRERVAAGEIVAVKRQLAELVVQDFHPRQEVERALANLDAEVPIEMQEVQVPSQELDAEGRMGLLQLLSTCGFAGSNRHLRVRVEQGACRLDGTAVQDPRLQVTVTEGMTISFGNPRKKGNWRRLRVVAD